MSNKKVKLAVTGYEVKQNDFTIPAEISINVSLRNARPNQTAELLNNILDTIQDLEIVVKEDSETVEIGYYD